MLPHEAQQADEPAVNTPLSVTGAGASNPLSDVPSTRLKAAADRSESLRELRGLLRLGSLAGQSPDSARASPWARLARKTEPRWLIDCLTRPGAGAGLLALELCN